MGEYTDNNYFYLPTYKAKGLDEKEKFDNALKATDTQIATNKSDISTIKKEIFSSSYTFADRLTEIGSTDTELIINSEIAINSDTTVPTNVTLQIHKGGKFTVASGVTLMINGAIKAGLYQIFDGDGTVSGSPKIDAVYPEWFGAVGDGTTDDYDAFVDALSFCKDSKSPLILTQDYKISATLTMPYYNTDGRNTTIPIIGSGSYVTASLGGAFAGYLLTYATQVDSIIIRNLRMYNSSGGGITFGESGGVHLDNVYFNEIASGYWAIYQSTGIVYTFNLNNSRIWHGTGGFYGGAVFISSGLNVHIANTFISNNWKDGPIIYIRSTHGFFMTNVQVEGNNSSTTNQSLVYFDGYCYSVNLRGLWCEGHFNKAINLGAGIVWNLQTENIYVQAYSDPNAVILDASGSTSHRNIKIENVNYVGGATTAGTTPLINDPNDVVRLENYTNSSTTVQANREWKQDMDIEYKRGTASSAIYSAGDIITGDVTLPKNGIYLLTAVVQTVDVNHSIEGLYQIIFDNYTYDYTVTELIGTTHSKGTVPPTSLSVSVNNTGKVTITATATVDGMHNVKYYYIKLGELNSYI